MAAHQLIYSFIFMIINLSDLVSMCKIQKNSYFQTRSERLIIIHLKVIYQEAAFVKEIYTARSFPFTQIVHSHEDFNILGIFYN